MSRSPIKAILSRHDETAELRQLGWTEGHIQRFQLYRAVYSSGYFQYDPAEYQRLHFARWLYQQGKISG